MLSVRVGQYFKWVGQSPEWVGHGLPGLGLEPPLD